MPPPRMEEIDFDLESIKYNRKHQEASNQQGMVVWGKEEGVVTGGNQEGVIASKNVKNKISVQHIDTGSGDNEIRDSDKGKGIEDRKESKDAGRSQSTESVSRIELMEKDLLALEKDLHTKGGDDLKIADINSKTANYGAMNTNAVENKVYTFRDKPDSTVDNEPRLARFVTLRDSGDRTASKIDINSAGEDVHVNIGIKDLETVNTIKLEDEGTLSDTITEISMQSKVDQNDQSINTSVKVTHTTGDCAKEIKGNLSEVIVDARDHNSEAVGNMNDKDISKLSTIDTLNKGDSIEQSHVDKLLNKIDNVPKLEIHLKETCASSEGTQSADLLKLRSVSSPNFEKTFPFASDELNHRTADIKAIDNLKKPDLDRTKTVLKSCMSEAVIKCDKTNHSKSDKSPSLRRKVESTCLTDQSDPLHSYQKSHDDSIFHSSLEMEEQKNRFKLKKALENIILAVSPYIHYDLPYLETEQGFRCELRRYFPEEIYWSHHFR